MLRSPLLLLLCLLGLIQINYAQSGWTRPQGTYYLQAQAGFFSSNDYYGTAGDHFPSDNSFQAFQINLYGEYGIHNRLTVLLQTPLQINSFSNTESVYGLGNIELGLKYRLLPNWPLSFAVELDIPTDDGILFASAKEPNELGIIEQINLPASDGEFNVWSTLAASQSSADGKTFGSVYTRFNFRTEDFSNQWQSGFELGRNLHERLLVIAKVRVQGRFSDMPSSTGSFLYGEGTTFTAAGLTGMYQIADHWRLVGTYNYTGGWLIDQRNSYRGSTFSLGVAYE